jgi:WD40 repeat protein
MAALAAAAITGLLGLSSCTANETCTNHICHTRPGVAPPSPVAASAPAWKGWPGAPSVRPLAPVSSAAPAPLSGTGYLALAVSPDGSRLIAVDNGGDVTQLNLRTGAAARLPAVGAFQVDPGGTSFSVAISPGLETLATAAAGYVSLQQVSSGTDLGDISTTLPSLEGGSGDLAFSPDGTWLAFRDGSGNAGVVNVATRQSRLLLTPGVVQALDLGGAESLAFSPDGKTLAVGTNTGTIDLWAVSSGRLLAALTDPDEGSSGLPPGVSALAFGAGGDLLAAGNDDGNVYLWNVARRSVAGALAGTPARSVTLSYRVAFSPDGRLLAASFSDGSIRVWSAATGARLAVLRGGQDLLDDPIAFALGGSLLLDLNDTSGITEWTLH